MKKASNVEEDEDKSPEVSEATQEGEPHRIPSIFVPPELEELDEIRDDLPIWLQTGPDMKKTANRMNYETISFHILDAGYGACAVMTFREIEHETNEKFTSPTDIYSSGTLGRLLCAVRRKILEVGFCLHCVSNRW